jgi:hypothetical protein
LAEIGADVKQKSDNIIAKYFAGAIEWGGDDRFAIPLYRALLAF